MKHQRFSLRAMLIAVAGMAAGGGYINYSAAPIVLGILRIPHWPREPRREFAGEFAAGTVGRSGKCHNSAGRNGTKLLSGWKV
jgi:hypothetical protein